MEQTIEGNRLIAEFLNKKLHDDWIAQDGVLPELEYHTSWDWLMPVVEKIEKIKGMTFIIDKTGINVYSFGKSIKSDIGETKILSVWNAVVSFIKWYNENKK